MTEAMGHGVNQRKAIEMTPAEVDAFLAERRPMTMCSLSPDGSIHAVAMWYGFVDGLVTVETKSKSQKAQNLRRDPRLTLLFEDGDYYEELRGVELVGKAELIEDPIRKSVNHAVVLCLHKRPFLGGGLVHTLELGSKLRARRIHESAQHSISRPSRFGWSRSFSY